MNVYIPDWAVGVLGMAALVIVIVMTLKADSKG